MRKGLAGVTLSILAGAVQAVYAQPDEEAQRPSPLGVELVEVRAFAEPLDGAPASATHISRAQIDTYLHGDLEQLEFMVPGLIVDSLQGTQRGAMISLRGIGSGSLTSGIHPAVGLYVDGVNVPTHTARQLDLFDVEQITVVRGVQGVFSGHDNLGGTIALRRTEPTGIFSVETRFESGSYNQLAARSRINLPLAGERLAAKITTKTIGGGGDYMSNCRVLTTAGTGVERSYSCKGDENQNDYRDLTTHLLWKPRSGLAIAYILERERDRSYTRSLLNFSRPADLLCANSTSGRYCGYETNVSVPQTLDFDIVDRNYYNGARLDGHYETLRIDATDPAYDLTLVVAARDYAERLSRDLDATSSDFLSTIRDESYEQLSLDGRVALHHSERFRYLLGLSTQRTETEINHQTLFILQQLADAGLITGPVAENESIFSRTALSEISSSAFIHLDLRMSEQWSGEIGARYTRDSTTVRHQPSGTRIGQTIDLPTETLKRESRNDTSYLGGLTYRVDPSSMLYFLVSQGFRSGGFDERAVSEASLLHFEPPKVKNYEMGLKTRWMDDHLRARFSAFQTNYRHKLERVPVLVESGNSELVTANLARQDIRGYEIELAWVPIDNLYLRFAAAHINAKYARLIVPTRDPVALAPVPVDPDNPNSETRDPKPAFDLIKGAQPSYAPWRTYALVASYTWPFAEGRIQIDAAYRYTGDYTSTLGRVNAGRVVTVDDIATYVPASFDPLPIGRVHNQGIWNLSVAYTWRHWRLRLVGQNLNNGRYLQNAVQTASNDLISLSADDQVTPLMTGSEYNRPRYVGFEIRYSASR